MNVKHIDSCKKATVLMSKSFEKKLSLIEKTKLEAHLRICKTCTMCFRQLKGIQKLFRKYPDAISSHSPAKKATLSTSAKKKIISKLNETKR